MPITLDWLGCATFRLTIGNLVVFLDAYIDRVPSAARTGITTDAVKQADWIVVGHSHFDHLYGAERIAKATGATIIGSYETVRIMEAQGVPLAQLMPVAGGEKIRLSKDVTVDVFPSQHSCVWSAQPMPAADAVCLGELGVTYQEQQEHIKALWAQLSALGGEVVSHLTVSAQGARAKQGTCNTPSLRNAPYTQDKFWDGRRANLDSQVLDPFLNSQVHGLRDHAKLLQKLQESTDHNKRWQRAFGSGVRSAALTDLTYRKNTPRCGWVGSQFFPLP